MAADRKIYMPTSLTSFSTIPAACLSLQSIFTCNSPSQGVHLLVNLRSLQITNEIHRVTKANILNCSVITHKHFKLQAIKLLNRLLIVLSNFN